MDRLMDKTQPHPVFKLATELGPLIVFFVANAKFNLFVATGAFMVAIVAAMIASYVVVRHVPVMAFVALPLTMVFAIAQMPVIKRYHLEPATLEASEAEAGDVSKG